MTTTDLDGRYRVGGLRAGTYRVGFAGGTPDPPDAVAGITRPAQVEATGYDFAERPADPLVWRAIVFGTRPSRIGSKSDARRFGNKVSDELK